jgi:hypothetical protein
VIQIPTISKVNKIGFKIPFKSGQTMKNKEGRFRDDNAMIMPL